MIWYEMGMVVTSTIQPYNVGWVASFCYQWNLDHHWPHFEQWHCWWRCLYNHWFLQYLWSSSEELLEAPRNRRQHRKSWSLVWLQQNHHWFDESESVLDLVWPWNSFLPQFPCSCWGRASRVQHSSQTLRLSWPREDHHRWWSSSFPSGTCRRPHRWWSWWTQTHTLELFLWLPWRFLHWPGVPFSWCG